jgi:hypothetical protein
MYLHHYVLTGYGSVFASFYWHKDRFSQLGNSHGGINGNSSIADLKNVMTRKLKAGVV